VKQYMVIEKFLPGCKSKIYARFHAQGRMLPQGLVYINSWLEKHGNRCFQLMETDDPALFGIWTERWKGLVNFEVIELGEKPNKNQGAAPAGASIRRNSVLEGRRRHSAPSGRFARPQA
jgi:hypothetical protein